MTDIILNEPTRDAQSGEWTVELTDRDTGRRLEVTAPRHTRKAALHEARTLAQRLIANKEVRRAGVAR